MNIEPHLDTVKAILFDVFGTVVDWRGSIVRELTKLGERRGLVRDWGAFADRWRAGYHDGIQAFFNKERTWLPADTLHHERLQELKSEFGLADMSTEELEHLNQVWHRLAPWPDSVAGLSGLKRKYTIGALSNGNDHLLAGMAESAGLPWDVMISAETFKSYKPDPAVYLGAVDLLGCQPHEVMLVAAHIYDLHGARKNGLRTAFVFRPDEFGDSRPKPDLSADGPIDLDAADFVDLARKMGALGEP